MHLLLQVPLQQPRQQQRWQLCERAGRQTTKSLKGLDCNEEILQRVHHCGFALAGASPAAASAAELAALPEGWASTKDAQGRTYFWHKTTKKVQWDRPTADTPIS